MASLLIAGIAVGEEKQQPLTIGRILPKATSTEVSKEKPTLALGKIVPREQKPDTKDVPERPRFPKHWGKPPAIQTRDMVKLPADFGKGSSTLARWIKENLKEDAKNTDKEEGKKKPDPKKPVEGQKPKPPVKPNLPEKPQPPKELKEKIDLYKRIQDSLRKGLKEKIDALDADATREDVKKVADAYKKANADRIEDAAHLGKQIQQWHKENRPERPKRPEPSGAVKEKLAKVRLVKNDLDVARKVLGQELRGKSKEDAAELIKAFKDAQKERHQELKDAKQDLQKLVREAKQDGDRRK